ncbi:MAG: exosortase-associated EpsI family protein [Verrucomicrobiota bacterium]|nr:exosortase-associated EpsI family protein [Verrucomicrobiota bacterium]
MDLEKPIVQNETLPAPVRNRWKENLSYLGVILLLVGTILVVKLTGEVKNDMVSPVRVPLPATIGSFVGREIPVSDIEKKVLPEDTLLSKKLYTDPRGLQIFVTAVVSGAEARSIHRPQYCLPGQGWNIGDEMILPIGAGSNSFQVTRLTAERNDILNLNQKVTRKLVDLYWFSGHGRSTAKHWKRSLWSTTDRLFQGVNQRWAFISIFGEVTAQYHPSGLDEAATTKLLSEFAVALEEAIVIRDGQSTNSH